ncbi:DUF2953 domain-containing protein [Sporolactobacillus kofuensis]|uniref:DUF2953 domain-containing protein n=1 Tax=Sporolactobacillus kofuensis TaxID=269672 RepID=A0ABW1WCU2_9BACL|nr:DUF2953 domain-containing protein [Sporolactobacillus kofuensis]MCO7175931.1 DUF2953 domain-containing protein [Sporolactobacillus kofuensis]
MVRLVLIVSGVILCLLVIVMIAVLRSVLTLRIHCLIGMHQIEIKAELYLWRKRIWTFPLKLHERKKKKSHSRQHADKNQSDDVKERVEHWSEKAKRMVNALQQLPIREKIKVSQMSWVTTCGSGDAAETALLCGVIWSLKSSIIPWIAPISSDHPRINVIPRFQGKCLYSSLSCMFQIRIGDAIVMIKKIRHQLKEG